MAKGVTNPDDDDLFQRYARASIDGDPERLARFYAKAFIAAGPRGSGTFNNDDAFREWLRETRAANVRAGMTSIRPTAIVSATVLSPRHRLVVVEWGARFEKTGDELVTFRIAYLLEEEDGKHCILAFVSEADQETVMKAKGLL